MVKKNIHQQHIGSVKKEKKEAKKFIKSQESVSNKEMNSTCNSNMHCVCFVCACAKSS